MGVTIKNRPAPPAPAREGVLHLRATPRERKACTGYEGQNFGLLCVPTDPIPNMKETTYKGSMVTCPDCLRLLPKAVEELTRPRWATVGRKTPPQEAHSAPPAPAPARAAPTPAPAKPSPYADF